MANKQSLSKVNLKGAELQQMIRNMPVLKSVKHEQQDVNGDIKNMMMVFGKSYDVIKSQKKKLRDDEKKLEAAALLATYRQGLEATQTEDDFETLAKEFDEFIKADFDDAKGKEFWLAHGQDILDANKADTEKLREIKSVEFGKNSLDQLLFNAQNMIALAPNGDKYLEMGGEEIAQSVFLSEAEKEKYRESFYKNGILNLALQDAKKAESFRANYLPDDEGLKGEIEKIAELRVNALEQQKQKSIEQEKFDAQKEAVSLWQRKEKGELDEASYYVLAKGLNGAENESEEENFDVCEAYRLLRQINAGENVVDEEIFKADKGLREAYQRGEIGFEEVKFAQNFMFNKEGQNNRGVDRAINELMDRIMLADVNEDSAEARAFMAEKAKLALGVSEAYYARKNELIGEAKEQGKTISLGVLTACARKAMHEVRDMFDFAEDEEGISFAELENELEENYPNADRATVWKEFAKRAPYAKDKSGLIKRIADTQNGIKLAENEYAGVVSDGTVDKGGEETEVLSDDEFIQIMGKNLIRTEKMKDFIYLDKNGHITVGIGNMLDNEGDFKKVKWEVDGRLATEAEIDEGYKIFKSLQEEKDEKGKQKYLNYKADYFKQFSKLRVSEETMIKDMEEHVIDDLRRARSYLHEFDSLPLSLRLIIMNFYYNRGHVKHQKGLVSAMRQRDSQTFKRIMMRGMEDLDNWTLEQFNQIPKSFWKR